MVRRHGWRSDKQDDRDFLFKHLRLRKPVPLPSSIDLRPLCSSVVDQGNLGSCTGNASAGVIEFLELKELREKIMDAPVFDRNQFWPASRLFIYYNARVLDDAVQLDNGATIRNVIKGLARWGACREFTWPYYEEHFADKPSDLAYQEAAPQKLVTYYRLTSFYDIKRSLAEGYPVIFGMMLFPAMETVEIARTGIVPDPKENDQPIGGHAVVFVGYDDAQQRFLVRNSWGTDWGQAGYFWLSYNYVRNPDLVMDFWTIRR